jgi:hypothetical protein
MSDIANLCEYPIGTGFYIELVYCRTNYSVELNGIGLGMNYKDMVFLFRYFPFSITGFRFYLFIFLG